MQKPREEASLRCGFPWLRTHKQTSTPKRVAFTSERQHCGILGFSQVGIMEPPSGFTSWWRSFPRVDSSHSLLTLPAVSAKETPSAFLRQPIVTTGRFVAFAPHVTRGLQTAIVSGVRHNSSSLASALNGETILQRKRLRCF